MKHLWYEKGAYASKKAKAYIANEFSPEKIKKIAVIRHAALGDQVITRPFLIEARRFFPNAEITLVGVANYQYGLPSDLVDHTIIMADRIQKKDMSVKQQLDDFRQLDEQDIIFDLAGTSRSHWMTFFSQAKLKFGFPYHSIMRGTLYNIAVFRSDFQPELECMLDMLKMLGHSPKMPLDFGYPKHDDVYVDSEQPEILYFNGASQTRKILTQEQMKQLMEKVTTELPHYKHVYLEGKNDFEKAGFLTDLTTQDNFAIQPCLDLDALIERIAKAKLVVAPDTGIRNIAVSTYTPTVGIFYITVPFRYTPLDGRHHIVMNANGDIPSNEQIIEAIHYAL
ncbi:glycosyltransferase family 9 protein [Vibrio sp. E150_011]